MLVFVQNDPEVPAGTYGEELSRERVTFEVVEAFRHPVFPPLDETSSVIVLGGSMGVHDLEVHPFLRKVREYILRVLDSGKPYLGICLGGQLLADVLEARVYPDSFPEIGTGLIRLTEEGSRDPLFRSVPGRFATFQWHSDSFALPGGAVRLASSSGCPNQAFRYGETAYGLQFHPEVNREIVTSWCRGFDSANRSPESILSAFEDAESRYREVSMCILHNFLDISASTSRPSGKSSVSA